MKIDTAEIIDQAIERVIQQADITPRRRWRDRQDGRGSQSIKGSQGIRGNRSSKGNRIETIRAQKGQNTRQIA